ncbi:MAG: hypothetical protein HY033_05000 [Ignavibacteriae bacterium]|nr:hypothetical protein [Ignavibacteria bacterium]MBI3364248.1 hypothetical protein [Ignavibacteriota bacterium]
MPTTIDAVLEDARVLDGVARKHAADLVNAGVTSDELAGLEALINTASEKDTQQKQSQNTTHAKTQAQNDAMARSAACIRKLQTAAKAVFLKDKSKLKEFHIGAKPPATVKAMSTELAYMKEIGEKYKVELAARGIKDADIASLDTCANDLTTANVEQENTRRLQVTATNVRDKAIRDLKDAMYRLRKSAEIQFGSNSDVLNEFRTIIVQRAAKKTNGAPEPTQPVPAGDNKK